MLNRNLFRRPRNPLEGDGEMSLQNPEIPEELYVSCPACKAIHAADDLEQTNHVCPKCGHHFRISARKRIELMTDADSFEEMWPEMESINPIDFPGYEGKLKSAREKTGEHDAVVTGKCRIEGNPACIFAMESGFFMGSMGTAVGEKITRLFEYALENALPVVGFCLSGGARMQEGIYSLMQMAKTTGAVKRHSDAGGLYVAVLCDPTTGGVTASFAMEGDITIAEPNALIGFAGPRVIEQTIHQKLKEGFQRAEFLLEKGFVDMVCDRRELKRRLGDLLRLHRGEEME